MTRYLGRIKMGRSCPALVAGSAEMCGTAETLPGKDSRQHRGASARQGRWAGGSKGRRVRNGCGQEVGGFGPQVPSRLRAAWAVPLPGMLCQLQLHVGMIYGVLRSVPSTAGPG